jgi:putative SOS response-associated peptidase YedK
MCGRYTLTANPLELQRELRLDAPPRWEPRFNLAPTQVAPIVTAQAPQRLTLARWGLLPRWAKDASLASKTINARAETVAQRSAFRQSFTHHRCLVPCNGFYEWRARGKQRVPLYIRPVSGRLLTMAGLWSPWKSPMGLEVATFTVITASANAFMEPLHDRMPVFLAGEDRAAWLEQPAREPSALQALLLPWRGEPFEAVEVSQLVNSVSFDAPECIAPARAAQLDLL